MKPLRRIVLLCILLSIIASYMVFQFVTDEHFELFTSFFRSKQSEVLFVGDVMLARNVEKRVHDVGQQHFFDAVRPLHERARYIVGNFEAVIPETHTQTPDFTFQFSVDPAFLPMLSNVGFTHFTLANNHSNDFGADGRKNTVKVLSASGFIPFGSPNDISSTSVTYIDIDNKKIALIGIQTVTKAPSMTDLDAVIEVARANSDAQIAVIHWGEEYQIIHSAAQELLARHLAAQGIDAIIGHHPHVVEDIGRIDGMPVFYSLGNYVFDQYFDKEVETGLTVLLSIRKNELVFDLVPVQSKKSVPQLVSPVDEKQFLKSLALRSDTSVRSDILRRTLRAEF